MSKNCLWLCCFFLREGKCLGLAYPQGVVECLGGTLAEVELVGELALLLVALHLLAVRPLLCTSLLARLLSCITLRRCNISTGLKISQTQCKENT